MDDGVPVVVEERAALVGHLVAQRALEEVQVGPMPGQEQRAAVPARDRQRQAIETLARLVEHDLAAPLPARLTAHLLGFGEDLVPARSAG